MASTDAYPRALLPRLLHHFFSRDSVGDAVVMSGDVETAFADVAALAADIAQALSEYGVGVGDPVTIQAYANAATWAGAIGCSMNGSPWIPVAPSTTERRLDDITGIAQSIVRLDPVINDASMSFSIKGDPGERQTPARRTLEADLAYVVFTSGSTGVPKGVPVSHRAAVNFLQALTAEVVTPADARVLSTAPFQFDVALCDLVMTIASGATLLLPSPAALANAATLVGYAIDQGATALHTVPSLLQALVATVDEGRLAELALRRIVVVGEALPAQLVDAAREVWPDVEVWNCYGQSETIGCSAHRIDEDDLDGDRVSVGRGIAGVEMALLAGDGRLTTDGAAVGELCLRSDSMFDGYLTDRGPQPVELLQGGWFRTGDVLERNEHGRYFYVSRVDDQVKVRGNRLELSAVDIVLLRHPHVAECAAVLVDGSVSVFVVPPPGGPAEIDAVAIRRHCREFLPDFATPRGVTVVEELPRLASGKIDRVLLKERATGTAKGHMT